MMICITVDMVVSESYNAVKAQKARLADGQIEQAIAESRGEFRVLRATRNTLVLRIDSMVLSFYRIT